MSSEKGGSIRVIMESQSPMLKKTKHDFCVAIEKFLIQMKDNGYYDYVFTPAEFISIFSEDILNYIHEKVIKMNETLPGNYNNEKVKMELIEIVKEEQVYDDNDDNNNYNNNDNEILNNETDIFISEGPDSHNFNSRIDLTPLTTGVFESGSHEVHVKDEHLIDYSNENEDYRLVDDIKDEGYLCEDDDGEDYHFVNNNPLAYSNLSGGNNFIIYSKIYSKQYS